MKAMSRKALHIFVAFAFFAQVLLAGIWSVNPTKDIAEGSGISEETATATYVKHQVPMVGTIEMSEYNRPKSIFTGKAIAIDSIEVKTEPAEDADSAGRLDEGCLADVLEQSGEWAKITSGNVSGFVMREALCFDEEAEAVAAEIANITALTIGENVNVYASMEAGAQVLTTLSENMEVNLLKMAGGYYLILKDGREGYVLKNEIQVDFGMDTGLTTEEIEAIEAERRAQEEAAAAAEAQRRAEEAEAYRNMVIAHTIEGNSITYNPAMEVSTEEIWLLACVIDWESAWQPYEGKLAVANVILNRVRSSNYPDSITGVIRAPYQFSGVTNNAYDWSYRFEARLEAGPRNDECMQAALEALSGANNIGDYNSFRSVSLGLSDDCVVIGDHMFH